ncbi:hypothetical protein COLO4_36877 [Corchorus olitorius]|uniref:Nucleic acid-binding protein n=1 Tax=Corchorus olitorius TaxID=93759 RepID=A0A1R3G4J8_9ROSI|nr:hypothetical protein COLO4_36877 [Corchorus olitorius]
MLSLFWSSASLMTLSLSKKDPPELIHVGLSHLRPSLMAYVIARVARKWETIILAETYPINTDLLLVDDKGDSMEVVIAHECMQRFSDNIVEGTVYKILHFQVSDRKKKYKFADMEEIKKRSERDPVFTDVIGMFVGYGDPIAVSVDSGTPMVDKIDINLRLLSGEILRVSFWANHISHLNLAELAAMQEKPIFAIGGTTVQSFSATKYLSSLSSTKIYVNPDIKEADQIRERFKDDQTPVMLLTNDKASQSLSLGNAKDATIFDLLYLDRDRAQGQKYRVEVHAAKGCAVSCTQHGLVTPRLVSVDGHRNQATRGRTNCCNQRQSSTPNY